MSLAADVAGFGYVLVDETKLPRLYVDDIKETARYTLA